MWRHHPILSPSLGWAFLHRIMGTMGTRLTQLLPQVKCIVLTVCDCRLLGLRRAVSPEQAALGVFCGHRTMAMA